MSRVAGDAVGGGGAGVVGQGGGEDQAGVIAGDGFARNDAVLPATSEATTVKMVAEDAARDVGEGAVPLST